LYLARDMLEPDYYAIVRPSVLPSVRYTGGSVKNG